MTVVDSFRKSELVDSLIDHEGLVLHQYVDSEGYATIQKKVVKLQKMKPYIYYTTI